MPVFFCTSCDCYGEGVFLISLFVFFFKKGVVIVKKQNKNTCEKKEREN